MGGGFAIVSSFSEPTPDQLTMVMRTLMRFIATGGTFAAAEIAEGEIADFTRCCLKDTLWKMTE